MSKNITMRPGIPAFDTPEFDTWLENWYSQHPPVAINYAASVATLPEPLRGLAAVLDQRIGEVFG